MKIIIPTFSIKTWLLISVFNLLLVSLLGVFMRLKMEFEFPWIQQKNWQLAHLNFAFDFWVGQMIFIWILFFILQQLPSDSCKKSFKLLFLHWILGLITIPIYLIYGVNHLTAILSLLALSIRFVLILDIWRLINVVIKNNRINSIASMGLKWAMIFHLIANLGTLALIMYHIFRMSDTPIYISTIYWYLHFSYNGWFTFGILSLLTFQFSNRRKGLKSRYIHTFGIGVVLTFGLSILWMKFPYITYPMALTGLVIQFYSGYKWMKYLYVGIVQSGIQEKIIRYIFIFIIIGFYFKFILQGLSAIPALSQFVFGIRPVIIAYLHYVLLSLVSVALLGLILNYLSKQSATRKGIIILITLIGLNQVVLSSQGFLALDFKCISHANYYLISIAILIALSLIWIIARWNVLLPEFRTKGQVFKK